MSVTSVNNVSFRGSYEEPKKVENKGFLAAQIVGMTAPFARFPLSIGIANAMKDTCKLSPEELKVAKAAVDKAMTTSGVSGKGYELIRVADRYTKLSYGIPNPLVFLRFWMNEPVFLNVSPTDKKVFKVLSETSSIEVNSSLLSKFSKYLKKININFLEKRLETSKIRDAADSLNSLKNANNAYCIPPFKKIILPENHLSLAGFHEIGHAMNSSFPGIGNILLKYKGLSFLAKYILLFSTLTKKQKPEEGKRLDNFEKTINFIRDNAGKLTALLFTPFVIEEAMASCKGCKLAKQLLNSSLLEKTRAACTVALSGYVLKAVAVCMGAALAVKVKDKIQDEHEAKVGKHNARINGEKISAQVIKDLFEIKERKSAGDKSVSEFLSWCKQFQDKSK